MSGILFSRNLHHMLKKVCYSFKLSKPLRSCEKALCTTLPYLIWMTYYWLTLPHLVLLCLATTALIALPNLTSHRLVLHTLALPHPHRTLHLLRLASPPTARGHEPGLHRYQPRPQFGLKRWKPNLNHYAYNCIPNENREGITLTHATLLNSPPPSPAFPQQMAVAETVSTLG